MMFQRNCIKQELILQSFHRTTMNGSVQYSAMQSVENTANILNIVMKKKKEKNIK